MKRIFLISFTVFLNLIFFTSCSENDMLPEEMMVELNTQACCGSETDPPPPPPPPPPGGGGGVGNGGG